MTIQMTCACGTNLSFEDAQLGQSGPCYQCGQMLTVGSTPVPAASPMAAAAAPMQPPAQAPFQFGSINTTEATGGGVTSSQGEKWGWRYAPFFGIMYGPIPVGIILVVVVGLVYAAAQ